MNHRWLAACALAATAAAAAAGCSWMRSSRGTEAVPTASYFVVTAATGGELVPCG